MAATADLLIRARADMASALSGLQQMQGAVSKLGATTASSGSSFGNFARQAGAIAAGLGIFQALSGAADMFKSSLIGTNALLENSTVAFTTMLGSGEQADSFLRSLAKFAQSTPFRFPELITDAQKMLAFGFTAEEVIPTLTSVGNAVAALGGSGELLNRVVYAFGQIKSRGALMGGEIRQLSEAGIPAWQMLANATGLPIPQLQKLSEQGQISADLFFRAFQQYSDIRFGDMMARQSVTFTGAMSNVADMLDMAIAKGFRPFFNLIRDQAVGLADTLMSAGFQAFVGQVTAASTALLGLVGQVAGTAAAVAPIIALAGAFFALNAVVGATPALLTGVISGLSALPGVFAGIIGAINPVTLIIAGLIVLGVVLYTAWVNNWGGIRDVVTSVADTISATISNLIGIVVGAVNTILGVLGTLVSGLGPLASQILGPDLVASITGALASVGDTAATIVNQTGAAVGSVAGVVGQGLGDIGDTVKSAGSTLGTALSGVLAGVMPTLPTSATTNLAQSVAGVGQAAAQTADPLQTMKDNLDAAKEAVSGTQDALSAARSELQRFAGAAMPGEWAIQDQMTALDVQIAGIKQSQAQKALDRMNRRPARTPGQQLARLELQKTILGYQMTPIEAQHKALQRLASDQVTMSFAVAAAGVTASKNQVTALEGELKARQNVVKEMEKAIKLQEAAAKTAAKMALGGVTGAGVTAIAGVGLPGYLPPGTAIVPGLGNTVPMTSLGRAPLPWEYYGGTTAGALGGPTMPSNVSLSVQVTVTGVGTELSQEIAVQTEAAVRTAFQALVTGAARTQGAASKSLPGAI